MIFGIGHDKVKNRPILFIGLERGNIDRLVAGDPIHVSETHHRGRIENDFIIFFGETQEDLVELFGLVGDTTPEMVQRLRDQVANQAYGEVRDVEGEL